MTSSQRLAKKFIIALIFLLILGGLGVWIYQGVRPVQPQPTPNPTANLIPIQIVFTKLFNVQNNDYDFLAKVTNLNADFGSPAVEYELGFTDLSGAIVSKKTDSFYILPGQTKYVVDSPLKFSQPIGGVELKIKTVDWQKLDTLAVNGITLLVKNSSYSPVLSQGIFAKAGGDVFNNSDFDLNKADVVVVALDQNREPLAVNKTEINTFLAKTTRGFEVTWFSPFVGRADQVDAEANTNVFENSNFLRQYGSQEKFKQQY